MPALENTRHETFALLVAQGSSDVAAYKEAYNSSQASAESNACRLREYDGVKNRIAELQAAAAAKAVLTIQEKREYCAEVLRGNIADVDEHSPLCQSYKRTDGEHGSSIEYKMPDKLKAIQIDNELAGHVKIVDRTAVNVNVNVVVLTDERRKELMEKKQAAILRRRGGVPLLPGRKPA